MATARYRISRTIPFSPHATQLSRCETGAAFVRSRNLEKKWKRKRYRYVTGGTHRSPEVRKVFERNNNANMASYRREYGAHFALIARRVAAAN
eukprot:8236621-Pyramimonas_sp.AAC.1